MKRVYFPVAVLILGLLLQGLACGVKKQALDPRVVIERKPPGKSVCDKGKVPEDKEGKIAYWLGRSTKRTTEEKAIADAYADAADYVLQYVATKGYHSYAEVNVEMGRPLTEDEVGYVRQEATILLATNYLQKLKTRETYITRYVMRNQPDVEYFDACVVVGIPNDDLPRLFSNLLRDQLEEARRKNNEKAEKLLEQHLKEFKKTYNIEEE